MIDQSYKHDNMWLEEEVSGLYIENVRLIRENKTLRLDNQKLKALLDKPEQIEMFENIFK